MQHCNPYVEFFFPFPSRESCTLLHVRWDKQQQQQRRQPQVDDDEAFSSVPPFLDEGKGKSGNDNSPPPRPPSFVRTLVVPLTATSSSLQGKNAVTSALYVAREYKGGEQL